MNNITKANKKAKKDLEEFKRGYEDYIKEHEKSPYQQGRDEAKRALEQAEELSRLIKSGIKEYY